ncbi:MAG TPA: DUF4350 domain-containing protein [Polyangiaceae bacterium]|nr:DUF4350 domain-containing protein [Polyangiaceae bacterium]
MTRARGPRVSPLRRLALAAALGLGLFGGRAAAAPFEAHDAGWEGLRSLVELAEAELGAARVVTASTLDWSTLTPADGLLLLHPERTVDADELAAFLRAGGRAAIVDDYGAGDRILQRYQIRRTPSPTSPLLTLRDNPGFAVAEPVAETVGGRQQAVHPVAAEVSRLVTNHPTGLLHPDLSPVLRIRARDEADVTLAVAGQVGKGRLFAMGDPSAIMNLMLRYPGNRAFAAGLVRYLVDDDQWGSRQGRLVLVSNRFGEKGAYGSDSALGRDVRDALRSLREGLLRVESGGLPRGALLSLSVILLAGLSVWVAGAAARRYPKPVPRFARPTGLLAQGGLAGRAAALAAPSTHRGLILLEQRHALEEAAGALLGLPRAPTMGPLVDELGRRKLVRPDTLERLKETLLYMAKVETAMAAGTAVVVNRRRLELAEQVGREVLGEAQAALGRGEGGGR